MSGRVEWMEVMMIARGVEISIDGGVAETEDGLTTVTFLFSFFFSFFLNPFIYCFYRSKCTIVLIPRC